MKTPHFRKKNTGTYIYWLCIINQKYIKMISWSLIGVNNETTDQYVKEELSTLEETTVHQTYTSNEEILTRYVTEGYEGEFTETEDIFDMLKYDGSYDFFLSLFFPHFLLLWLHVLQNQQ